MTNKELFYFTGKCLMLDEDPGFKQEIYDKISADAIDWQKFAALCSNHLILPVIYLKFLSHGVIEYLPEEFSEYLKEIYELNLARNNQILHQLSEITAIMNKSNIHPVFLKGAANLLDELYSNIGERIMGDIDFLVPEKDYLPTAKIFEAEGYSMYGPLLYFDIKLLKHYPPLSKPGVPAYLEIHQFLTEDNLSWFNPGIVDQEKITVKALKGCFVLSDRHKIIHNFIHGQLHHGGHTNGIVSFRDLYDLYLLSKRSSIKETLPQIKSKRKAIAYFVFAGKALGLGGRFYPKSNFSAWLFLKKHDLNLSSATFYYTYRGIVFIEQKIFIKYIGQFFKSFYSKNVRQSVIKRLTDRNWYIAQLHVFIDFFARRKKVESD